MNTSNLGSPHPSAWQGSVIELILNWLEPFDESETELGLISVIKKKKKKKKKKKNVKSLYLIGDLRAGLTTNQNA
jgi:hypothetical protein